MNGVRWSKELIQIRKRGAIWIMVGRPRKIGKREKNGRIARAITECDSPMREIDHFLNDPTVIYVTEAGPMAKIGFSKNPKGRSKQIQTGNGDVVRMVWYRWMDGKDARKLEKAIHKKYQGSTWHAHGEWYYMDRDTAIAVVTQRIAEMGLYSINEKWSAYVERPLNDPAKENLPNPFNAGAL